MIHATYSVSHICIQRGKQFQVTSAGFEVPFWQQ